MTVRTYVARPIPTGARVFYTDGSCWPNPGPGGCAVVCDGEVIFRGWEPPPTTNNRMEGMAILAALRAAQGSPAVIFTDSELWETTINRWARRKSEKPTWKGRANRDLLMPLWSFYQLMAPRPEVRWIKAHAGHVGNELADRAADEVRRAKIALAVSST